MSGLFILLGLLLLISIFLSPILAFSALGRARRLETRVVQMHNRLKTLEQNRKGEDAPRAAAREAAQPEAKPVPPDTPAAETARRPPPSSATKPPTKEAASDAASTGPALSKKTSKRRSPRDGWSGLAASRSRLAAFSWSNTASISVFSRRRCVSRSGPCSASP